MTYVSIQKEKRKDGTLQGIQSHNDRKMPPHNNKEIDASKSANNYELTTHKKMPIIITR
ncbi:plasmid recombination protein [Enterococcus sp. BWB1-3]|uniref:plasmid recombination protein n=1 Tax=Enterococcus sp. BWB1-3 TaxID=2787713 RepID=UPI001920FC1F|nr:plasmid recombination protein [Enterococcus sp. BWB1-3]MBL1230658.1 plasmid recombination protein [Enterococcus sp. BWB1-3]